MKTADHKRKNQADLRICLAFLLLVCCVKINACEVTLLTGGKDSLSPKYALNDPRNPDCPCHKLQKQAEDEYKALQQKQGKDQAQVTNPMETQTGKTVTENKVISAGSSSTTASGSSFHLFRSWSECYSKYRWRHAGKHSRKKKFHPDYSICFRWN